MLLSGAHLLLCPRATGLSSVDQVRLSTVILSISFWTWCVCVQWIRCGQTLAVIQVFISTTPHHTMPNHTTKHIRRTKTHTRAHTNTPKHICQRIGAFCLSSNRSGEDAKSKFEWGGSGFIAEPMSGKLLARTSKTQSYVTVEIDIRDANTAKQEYPCYVNE